MVARTAGGREVAGSNPVTPIFYKDGKLWYGKGALHFGVLPFRDFSAHSAHIIKYYKLWIIAITTVLAVILIKIMLSQYIVC